VPPPTVTRSTDPKARASACVNAAMWVAAPFGAGTLSKEMYASTRFAKMIPFMPFDPEKLRKTYVYDSCVPFDTIAAELAQVQSLADSWRRTRHRLALWGAITLLAGMAGLFLYWPVGIILIPIAIGLFVLLKRYPKSVANGLSRCECTKAIAGVLALDTNPKMKPTLRLEFNPKQELLSETPLPHRKNGKQRLYKAPWFTLENKFLDGTSLTETIDDLVRKRSFTNPRGKSKTKTRTHHLLAMRFAYPKDVYGDLTAFAAKMQKEIHLPPSASVRGLEVNDRAVKVKALVTQTGDLAQASTMLALGVYRMLNLSRKMRARRARQQKGGAR
jgi:hypothetical protein